MLIVVILVSILYALPTLYGEDPAIQISGTKQTKVDINTLTEVQSYLTEYQKEPGNQDSVKSISLENNQLLIRVKDEAIQSNLQTHISNLLGNNYEVAPNLASAAPNFFSNIDAEPIKKGLDLRGGVYFLLEIDMHEFINKKLEQLQVDIGQIFTEDKINYYKIVSDVNVDGNRRVLVTFSDRENLDAGMSKLKVYNLYDFTDNSNELSVSFSQNAIDQFEKEALDQNIYIIRNRINQLGVSEPVVQSQGNNRIVVQLPGIQDTVQAKQILGATATLEFRGVNDNPQLANQVMNGAVRVPFDSELYVLKSTTPNGEEIDTPYLLYKQIVLQGDHITDAKARIDNMSGVVVDIALDSDGGTKMQAYTAKNVGKKMATLYTEYKPKVRGERAADGFAELEKQSELANVATIQSSFSSKFQITGIGDKTKADQLAILLRAGSLTAPVQIIEENVIGPSMGKERIQQGLESCLWGLALTVLFMLVTYRLFGVFASLAVSFNLILIVAIMSIIPGATLTMPGIAGIVLTVGMAVDANVLINERIKEELRIGKNPQHAIDEGYKGAWTSIFDANITTLMTAVILYFAGTGSIKGFAITLGIGVLTSMFTSIVGTRALANLIYGGRRVKKLSI